MRLVITSAVAVLLLARAAAADTTRYFQAWSYTENAASGEIQPKAIGERTVGYWSLEFDDRGSVLGGTYHGADGAVWLTLRYVENSGRIYADLFGPTGLLITRKSTQLRSREPSIRP